jgi:6-phosphofructokinase
VAGGADVILIPEFEYDVEEVIRVCRERESGGQRFTIIAIAEGAKPKGGTQTVRAMVSDSPDPIRLGGVGKVLEVQLQQSLTSEVRTTVLGHMQRGGTPTAYDRNLATMFGSYAAAMVADGHFGHMVALQRHNLTSIALEEVAGKTRTVPTDSPMIASAVAVGTSFGVPNFDYRFTGTAESTSIA